MAKKLRAGAIWVIPTDTIYGVVTTALKKQAVARLYRIKGRTPTKPFIILISTTNDLKLFDIELSEKQEMFLNKIWPNPVSAILNCSNDRWEYLHRGTNALAFRIPNNKKLLEILKDSGPLVAPSANPEGLSPAENITQAKKYFKERVDFYFDGGELKSEASTLIDLTSDNVKIIRQGKFIVNETD